MMEIRICRKGGTSSDQDLDSIRVGPWHPDSPGNREMLRVILESGNEIDGPGSHWIETAQTDMVVSCE